ncbi:MAG: RHS repeat-associated core domain-containing protein [Chitinophagaceae bacterium]
MNSRFKISGLGFFSRVFLLIAIQYCLGGTTVFATDDPEVFTVFRGRLGELAPDSVRETRDPVYYSGLVSNIENPANDKYTNTIVLRLLEDAQVPMPTDFVFKVFIDITWTDKTGASHTITGKELVIDFKAADGNRFNPRSYFIFDNAREVNVRVDSIYSSGPEWVIRLIQLENRMKVSRDYIFDCEEKVSVLTHSLPAASAEGNIDELIVEWEEVPNHGITHYDIEWAWADAEAQERYKNGANFVADKVFKNNSSRITIPAGLGTYRIPLLYDGAGLLFYRVRPLQQRTTGQVREGYWSTVTGGSGITYYTVAEGHEPELNWQASTVYAEDGKRKTVIQYYDGTLRSRQTVTKDNVTQTTIVAETLYDYQGRPAINILPVPTLNNVIEFAKNFNVFNSSSLPKDVYDLLPEEGNICDAITPPMDSSTGASLYYSSDNALINPVPSYLNTGFHKYIPSAFGYPYSETRYTPDATGRIAAQGGVGPQFQLGTGRETKYYYGVADQKELDGLFGTEVGASMHYFKNMVRDANGQYSVSYVDMHGRTVATALAGVSPDSLDQLNSYRARHVKRDLLNEGNNLIKGRSVESSSSLLVTKAGLHQFYYKLTPQSVEIEACNPPGEPVCYSCFYDLEIRITGDCGQEPIVITRKNFTFGDYDPSCEEMPALEVDETFTLPEGEYNITKKLTLSKDAQDWYRTNVFAIKNICKTLEDFYDENYAILISANNCNTNCDTCRTQVGTYTSFRSRFLEEMNIDPGTSVAFEAEILVAYNDALAACEEFCEPATENKLEMIRKMMLEDMIPDQGQYARLDTEADPDGNGNPGAIVLETQKPYNIFNKKKPYEVSWTWQVFFGFSNYPYQVPVFAYPKDESDNTSYYKNEANQRDEDLYTNNFSAAYPPSTFSNQFKEKWAQSLLIYHPEYTKLKYAEQNLAASYAWDAALEEIDTWDEALAAGFISNNIVNLDPFFNGIGAGKKYPIPTGDLFNPYVTYKAKMQQYLSSNYKTGKTIWQLAWMTVKCKEPNNSSCVPAAYPPYTEGGCDGDWNIIWKIFRSVYLAEKDRMINMLLDMECQDKMRDAILGSSQLGYIKRFTGYRNTLGLDVTTIESWENSNNPSAAAGSYTDGQLLKQFEATCSGYIDNWKYRLETCDAITSSPNRNLIIEKIIAGLKAVCISGSDVDHPNGSSTVKPGDPRTPQSFEAVIASVLSEYTIPLSAVCHPYLIDYPEPYNQQTPVSAEDVVVETKDECVCKRLDELKAEQRQTGYQGTLRDFIAYQHGVTVSEDLLTTLLSGCAGVTDCNLYDPPLVIPAVLSCKTPLNTCIDCATYTRLKADFKTSFPSFTGVWYEAPATEDQFNQNKLFERFLNSKTGLNKSWADYLAFEEACKNYSTPWTCMQLDSVVAAYFTAYGSSVYGSACQSAFVSFFNSTFGTSYTFSQIQSLFLTYCGRLPDICEPVINCNVFTSVINSFYTAYGAAISLSFSCDSLFAAHFNQWFDTDYTYSELQNMYDSVCGKVLDVCGHFSCSRLGEVLESWKTCNRSILLDTACATQWVTYFNALMGTSLASWQIDSLYRRCGIQLDPCQPPSVCSALQELLRSYQNMNNQACAGSGLDTAAVNHCSDCFLWYVNDRLGTNYSYTQLELLYKKNCGVDLQICSTAFDCKKLMAFTKQYLAWYELDTSGGRCDSLFSVQFNLQFGTDYDYDRIMALYRLYCGSEPAVCVKQEVVTCQQLDYVYFMFQKIYPISYLADSCQTAFTRYFNQAFGDTLTYADIQVYYLNVCGRVLDICTPDTCAPLQDFVTSFNSLYGSTNMSQQVCRNLFTQLFNRQFQPLEPHTWADISKMYLRCGIALPDCPPDSGIVFNCTRLEAGRQAYYALNRRMLPDDCDQQFTEYINVNFGTSFTDFRQLQQWATDNCFTSFNVCNEPAQPVSVALRRSSTATSVLQPPRLCGSGALFPPLVEDGEPCDFNIQLALNAATEQYNAYVQIQLNNFDSSYASRCLSVAPQEEFWVRSQVAEYHYTLYYYDQAGNLVKTVPPEGVDVSKLDEAGIDTWSALVKTARDAGTALVPDHLMATEYRYNSLNQVVAQKSPDGGSSRFWYDRIGRLVLSQNEKQQGDDKYSYTLYDALGRITEVGQLEGDGLTQAITQDPDDLAAWLTAAAATREQITRTYYDLASADLCDPPAVLCQTNLRNRVSYSTFTDAIADASYASATYYSYDIHGNVDVLLQHYIKGVLHDIDGHAFKRIEYKYDLISGKVNQVAYQPGLADQFYHRYEYDAENRLTGAYTSHDALYWERQAQYNYYKHGPLARVKLGELSVQGIDYAYTLQGWLKGINSSTIGPDFDMGNHEPEYMGVARDVYGFSLNYFAGDYKAIKTSVNPFAAIDYLPGLLDGKKTGRGLYNGNISSMLVNIPKLGEAQLYGYSYDQLNRLTGMNAYTGLNSSTNGFTPAGDESYKERISYDGNGNILTYLRQGEGSNIDMDNLSYAYNLSGGRLVNNKLRHVTDAVTTTPGGYGDLKNGQANDNYGYDAIGNLTKDESEGIASGGIEWNVYGKISQITKTNGGVTTVIKYTYDATGNRIGKWVQVGAGTPKQTAYVRDASGNVMAIYEKGNSEVNGGLLSQIEVPLYGSSRLGVWRPDREVETTGWELFETEAMMGTGNGLRLEQWSRGRTQFELTNHLGNVLVTISDRKLPVVDESVTICDDAYYFYCYSPVTHYTADVLTANDYYPFGMGMPGRKYSEDEYRYGFNGKEKDSDINSLTAYDYGFRIYNPAIGRFLSVDPLIKEYPYLTPYQFASNMPIFAIDRDGREFEPYWATTVPQKIREYERELWLKDPKNAEQIIFHKNVNAFLFVGGALTVGWGLATVWRWFPQVLYNPVVQTEIVGTLAALTGYEGPDIPSPGMAVEAGFKRTWSEVKIVRQNGKIISEELVATAELAMEEGAKFANNSEKKITQKLLSEGKSVKVLAESREHGKPTPDFLVNGVITEFKEISNITKKDVAKGIKDRIEEGLKQSKYSNIIIDVSKQQVGDGPVTEAYMRFTLDRLRGNKSDKDMNIRVIGAGFDFTWEHKAQN